MSAPKSMMERFAESGFAPVEFEGRLVHPLFRRSARAGDVVRVQWISAASPRPQGLMVRLRVPGIPGKKGYGGLLRIDDVRSPAMALWMETAPPVVELSCDEVLDGAELRVSNRWRTSDGVEHEWLNNYGMLVEESEGGAVVLRISDGYGDAPTFDDLVVSIAVITSVSIREGGRTSR